MAVIQIAINVSAIFLLAALNSGCILPGVKGALQEIDISCGNDDSIELCKEKVLDVLFKNNFYEIPVEWERASRLNVKILFKDIIQTDIPCMPRSYKNCIEAQIISLEGSNKLEISLFEATSNMTREEGGLIYKAYYELLEDLRLVFGEGFVSPAVTPEENYVRFLRKPER